jgi:hypothetical protein
MKRIATLLIAAAALAAAPQQFHLNFDQLAAKASNSVDISLPAPLLKLAANFLDSGDADEAAVKKLVANIDGVYIRHFEFKSDNVWTQADVDSVRNQLKAPEWSRIVGVKSDSDGQNAEIYLRIVDGKTSGVAIIETESREFTVVNIVGNIDLNDLGALSGHFDIPKVKIPKDKKK